MEAKTNYRGLGRRKSSTARVLLILGQGKFTINQKPVEEYLKSPLLIKDTLQPFTLTNTENQFDIKVNVSGGGLAGQAGAIRLGIARALLEVSPDYRTPLKKAKMVTRDPRRKERKKPGLRSARRARQFSKR
ncbi:30S ribosomal protein S9 [Mycoplasma sp. ATU-Cv-703]|uniref:30S ribosomal protein S9 n=1 Tax=Mycoplasma sp. ATU-Cv-703 TaxID=2498595 RepID=UPI000FDF2EBC